DAGGLEPGCSLLLTGSARCRRSAKTSRVIGKPVSCCNAVESIQGDVLETVAVGEMVITISYLKLKRPAWRSVVDVSVLHCRAGGLFTEVPGFQVVEPGKSPVAIDHVENLICI